MKRVLLSEDVSEDIIQNYIDAGFKPYFLSKRKIRKKDKKVWKKLQKFNIDPGTNLLFSVKKGSDWDEINISGDHILDKLLLMGNEGGKSIMSRPVNSMEEAIAAQDMVNDIELRFVTVKVKYRYSLREGVPPAKSGSRPFCSQLMATPNKLYTLEEIQSLNNGMKGVSDVFLYRGGFFHNTETGETTPFCRHQWAAEVVIER
jgi:hypothetical protein